MVLFFDPDGERRHRPLAPDCFSRALVQQWEEVHRFASASVACVLILPRLYDPGVMERLERFRAAYPVHPTVIVPRLEAANLALLRRFRGWEVVWLADTERRLQPALRRAIHASMLLEVPDAALAALSRGTRTHSA